MNRFKDLCVFFEEYASFLEDMELVQKEKLESVLSGDLQRMESSIKTQQAYAMRFENIESKRIRTQEAAGFSNYTFSQLIEAAEPAVRTSCVLCSFVHRTPYQTFSISTARHLRCHVRISGHWRLRALQT